MQDYLILLIHHVINDYIVIIINNSDTAKPDSKKSEPPSEIREDSTGEITLGYLTIEAAVLSENGTMSLPIYEKVFSAAVRGIYQGSS